MGTFQFHSLKNASRQQFGRGCVIYKKEREDGNLQKNVIL